MIRPRPASRRSGTRARGLVILSLPGVWVAAVLGLVYTVPGGAQWAPAAVAAPALACAGTGRRRCVLVGGGLAVAAVAVPDTGQRLGTEVAVVAVLLVCLWLADRRARLTAELDRTQEIALAAQQALLPPLPHRVSGLAVAGYHLSASRGARVGGDLYEVLATPYGVRAVIGDVRGHGLEAVGTVAALLGSFREAAHEEPELGGVLRRLDRALHRHLRERPYAAEEFVTLILLELDDDCGVQVVNCGHPQPYRLCPGRAGPPSARPLDAGEPLPPLGLFDPARGAKAVPCGELLPGQALFLHTDGVTDARDTAGEFFALSPVLERAAQEAGHGAVLSAGALVETVRAAFLQHTRGRLTDDMALLVLHRDVPRVPTQAGAHGAPTPAPRRKFPECRALDSG
ncbi:PP2C family protein-serine/threonine phosphatase [Actinacidiphila sp. bgisy167]|uniref:PP2C family protein-serine/threonine phosphatase n=1 Tax=Actinacidiphila sp. bgisy167 TaxID=3413797 RepID=UPI003D72F1A1